MPVTLHDFIHAADHGDDGIAGYLEPDGRSSGRPRRFLYWRSSNPMLPAFVNCLEGGGDMQRIYTNEARAPWARPRGPGVKRRDVLRADDGDGGVTIEPVPMSTRRWPVRVAGTGGLAPLAGGLHAAASDVGADRDGGDASGLARVLRHYALATRTLIASSAASGFAGVHDHVGAILVGDDGAILAAGINTGSYRHAEVSLLLSWFRDHPEARTLPPKSIVISTLTPCRQCTRLLSRAMAPDTLIRFDEADAGRSGRAGERIAERIDAGDDGLEPAPVSGGPIGVREAERRALRNAGAGGPSRLDRSREARRAILAASDRATRSCRGDEARARAAEAAVPSYLARWVLDATPAA